MKFVRSIFRYFAHISLLLAASFPVFAVTTAEIRETQLCDRIDIGHNKGLRRQIPMKMLTQIQSRIKSVPVGDEHDQGLGGVGD